MKKGITITTIKQAEERIRELSREMSMINKEIHKLRSDFVTLKNQRNKDFNENIQKALKEIKDTYGMDICAQGRSAEAVAYRSCFINIVYNDFNISLSALGMLVGRRDHSTVIHSRDKVNDLLSVNDEYYTGIYNKVKEIIDKNLNC